MKVNVFGRGPKRNNATSLWARCGGFVLFEVSFEWIFCISYGDSYGKAKELILSYIDEDERILKDKEPFVALHEMADSSINIVTRAWVDQADYWPVYFEMNERIYEGFPKAGLSIPFPQMDIHLHKTDS